MDEPGRQAARLRHEAEGFAREARRAARRHRRRLPGGAREAIDAAAAEVEQAARGEDPERLAEALRGLEGRWEDHLAPLRPGPLRRFGLPLLVAAAAALALRGCAVEVLRVPSGSMEPTLVAGDHLLVWKAAYGLRLPLLGFRPFGGAPVRRGDVVALASPAGGAQDWVRRVVGLPGDVIELREQVLYVNGVPQPREPGGERTYEELNEETGVWWPDTCRLYRERIARGDQVRPASAMPVDREERWRAAAAQGVTEHSVLQCRRIRVDGHEGPFEVVRPGHVFVLGDNRDRASDSRVGGGWQVPVRGVEGRVVAVAWSWGRGSPGGAAGRGLRLDRLFKVVE